MDLLDFLEQHFVSLVMSTFFLCFVGFMIKFNLSNGGYQNFKLAHMVMTKEGFLDRRAVERFGLYLMSMYGFLHVLHKVPDQISTYFSLMAGIWLTAHVAGIVTNKFPDKKEPDK